MGMDSELICIGPFDPALVRHYQYAPEAYAGVRLGALITTGVFASGLPTSRQSWALAEAVGVRRPYGRDGIKLDPAEFDHEALTNLGSGHGLYSEEARGIYSRQIEALLVLADAGYDVFFMANG